jgi:phosphatidate cytidylyltransferase
MNLANLGKRVAFVLWAIPLSWIIVNATISLTTYIPIPALEQYFAKNNVIIYPGHLLAITMIFLGCYEYISMLSHLYHKNGFWLIYLYLLLISISQFVPNTVLTLKHNAYILFLLVAIEAFVWGTKNGKWQRASLLFSGTFLLVIALVSLLEFYDAPFQSVFPPKFDSWILSQLGIVLICTTVFICDSAAYFVGSIVGKHHFSSISPNKTIEGSIAGLIGATITGIIGWYFLADSKFPLYFGAIMGILIGIMAQIGDLLVSLIKRYFRVKDASNLIPGHGGMLDRFDSLFFTAPVVNLFIIIIHRLIP